MTKSYQSNAKLCQSNVELMSKLCQSNVKTRPPDSPRGHCNSNPMVTLKPRGSNPMVTLKSRGHVIDPEILPGFWKPALGDPAG